MSGSIFLADLTWVQIRDVLAGSRIPVLLLPLGAVEAHGPHAPLGTDTLISLGMCERAARTVAGDADTVALVLPPLTYGVTEYAASFAGTIGIRPETLSALIEDVCEAAIKTGFRRIAIVNNHFEPEQIETIRRFAAASGRSNGTKISYLDLTRRANAARLGEEFRSGSCHAGRYETSLVLAERADLVDTSVLRDLAPLPVDMPAAIAEGRTDFPAMHMDMAYCGSPADGTADEGRELFVTLSAMLVDLIHELARD